MTFSSIKRQEIITTIFCTYGCVIHWRAKGHGGFFYSEISSNVRLLLIIVVTICSINTKMVAEIKAHTFHAGSKICFFRELERHKAVLEFEFFVEHLDFHIWMLWAFVT